MQLKKLRLLSLSFLVSCSEGIDNGAEPQDEVQECKDPDHSPEVGVSQPVSLPFFVLHDESPQLNKLATNCKFTCNSFYTYARRLQE